MSLYLFWGIFVGALLNSFVSSCAGGLVEDNKENIKVYLSTSWSITAAMLILSIALTMSVYKNGYPNTEDDPRPTPTIVELGR